MTTPNQLHCFSASPTASLTSLQREVLQVLRDARGFFRSSGMTQAQIADRMHSDCELKEVGKAVRGLVAEGLAEVAPRSNPAHYRLASPGKRARVQALAVAA